MASPNPLTPPPTHTHTPPHLLFHMNPPPPPLPQPKDHSHQSLLSLRLSTFKAPCIIYIRSPPRLSNPIFSHSLAPPIFFFFFPFFQFPLQYAIIFRYYILLHFYFSLPPLPFFYTHTHTQTLTHFFSHFPLITFSLMKRQILWV